jgi:hypothetical protein
MRDTLTKRRCPAIYCPAWDEEYEAGGTSSHFGPRFELWWHGQFYSALRLSGVTASSLLIRSSLIIMAWMLKSRKPPRPVARYVVIPLVLAMCLSGSKRRSTLVVFLRCCCMVASRGASRLSPPLACATGITI